MQLISKIALSKHCLNNIEEAKRSVASKLRDFQTVSTGKDLLYLHRNFAFFRLPKFGGMPGHYYMSNAAHAVHISPAVCPIGEYPVLPQFRLLLVPLFDYGCVDELSIDFCRRGWKGLTIPPLFVIWINLHGSWAWDVYSS